MTIRQIPEAKPLFLERMQKLLSNEKDFNEYMKMLKVPIVKSIRCNKLKISPESLKKRLEEKGWKIKQPWKNFPEVMIIEGKYGTVNDKNNDYVDDDKRVSKRGDNLVDLSPGELGNSIEHLLGYYYVQELASMLPVIALNPERGETILDLCASPGSKTTQLASETDNSGTIIANEISIGRIKILANNLERCGVSNVIITKKEGSALCRRLNKLDFQFNKILVDAPCSGEGTLRSSPRTYIMWNINSIKQLSGIQKNLVSSAIPLLKVGGELIYSTCTHAPEEDEEIVDFILKNFPEMKIQKIFLPVKSREGITNWEGKSYSKDTKLSHRIYPQDNNTEGFFLAKFRKIK
ncbi:MAG TPA: RsmB/NOP family class I SAM-dependent RNA methyltransferase [Patescibacteria group bacterium]|nr:RsmB/NOP family class I SAM-dependent RNA methyltransferase [Patescibacteria group bacterium]